MGLCMAFLLFDIRRGRSSLKGAGVISAFSIGFCALDGALISSPSDARTEELP